MCGAVLLAMALFAFLVWDTLDGANDMIAEVEAKCVDGDHTSTRRNKSSMTGLDGYLLLLMVLFYTLFLSVVSRHDLLV
jgi:hypothetical protein